mgnify:CR=1 FL=1
MAVPLISIVLTLAGHGIAAAQQPTPPPPCQNCVQPTWQPLASGELGDPQVFWSSEYGQYRYGDPSFDSKTGAVVYGPLWGGQPAVRSYGQAWRPAGYWYTSPNGLYAVQLNCSRDWFGQYCSSYQSYRYQNWAPGLGR